METIVLNTDELKQKADEINSLKIFFDNNKEKYLKYRYSDNISLYNAVGNIYRCFESISDNLDVINRNLKEYCNEIESLERTYGEVNDIRYKSLEAKQKR